MRIVWECNNPTPYNTKLFDYLECDSEIDLACVYYKRRTMQSHPWQGSKICHKSKYASKLPIVDFPFLYACLTARETLTVLGGWNSCTNLLAMLILVSLRKDWAVWTDTPKINGTDQRKSRIRQVLLKWIFRNATVLLGTGRVALENLKELGAPENKLVNFPYWIDIRDYESQNLVNKNNEKFKMLSVGRLDCKDKGYDLAIQAIANLVQCGFDIEYQIAGTGPDVGVLQEIITANNLEGRVNLSGWKEPSEILALMSEYSYFLHPAPKLEPYGVVILEAMASGMIVIASTNTGAAMDRITDGQNGFLLDKDLLSGLKRALTSDRSDLIASNAALTASSWPLSRAVEILSSIHLK